MIAQLKQSGDTIVKVLKDPGGFAQNLIKAVGGGFKQFSDHAPRHLAQGVGKWLTGTSGISFPDKLDFQGVFLTVLSVLGLTYQNFRAKLVSHLGAGGKDKVAQAEKMVDAVQGLKSGGMLAAEEMKGSQNEVGSQVKNEVIGEISKSVIFAAVTKIVSMFVPGGGFISALVSAFDTVTFLIDKGRDLISLGMGVIQSVGAIATGNVGAAIGGVERSLAATIPLALSFLSKLLHLGNIGGKVTGIIKKLKAKLDRVVDKVMTRVAKLVEKVLGKGKKAAGKVKDKAKALLSGIFGKKSFTGGKEGHSVWVDLKAKNAKLMIASTPREAETQLDFFANDAKKRLGGDPQNIYSTKIAPLHQRAKGEIVTEKAKLKTAISTLPEGEREAKMEMGVRASNITSRVANITQNLLDEIAKHAGAGQSMTAVTLSFDRVAKTGRTYDLGELRLQLAEQENALRRMTVQEWLRRYPFYPGASKSAKQTVKKADKKARDDARKQEAERLRLQLEPGLERQYLAEGLTPEQAADRAEIEAEKQVETFMASQAALHTPDKQAGGHYLMDINGVGDGDVNSFIGSQWNSGGKVGTLKTSCDAVDAAHRSQCYVNVRLELR